MLYKKAIPFLAQNLSKVPIGGNNINIGKDKIMGHPPLLDIPDTHHILSHFYNRGLNILSHISNWDIHSQFWTDWHFPSVPAHLEVDLCNLKNLFYGTVPLKKYGMDFFHWDPSGSAYTIKASYTHLCSDNYPSPI